MTETVLTAPSVEDVLAATLKRQVQYENETAFRLARVGLGDRVIDTELADLRASHARIRSRLAQTLADLT
jgi:hypothetical protein